MKRVLASAAGAAALAAAVGLAPTSPDGRVVAIRAPDGTALAASDFAPPSAGPGPGVLLLHQGNRDRKSWEDVASRLAKAGIHAVTVDLRGFGDSGGTPHAKWTSAERSAARKATPDDVDAAWQFLVSQPGVTRGVVGIGGAGADGVGQAVAAARRHPTEVKSLALLSGETDLAGGRFLKDHPRLPILFALADDDEYPPTQDVMAWTYSVLAGPGRRFVHYGGRRPPWLGFEDREGVPDTGGHGTDMFRGHPELAGILADWFVETLVKTPAAPTCARPRRPCRRRRSSRRSRRPAAPNGSRRSSRKHGAAIPTRGRGRRPSSRSWGITTWGPASRSAPSRS